MEAVTEKGGVTMRDASDLVLSPELPGRIVRSGPIVLGQNPRRSPVQILGQNRPDLPQQSWKRPARMAAMTATPMAPVRAVRGAGTRAFRRGVRTVIAKVMIAASSSADGTFTTEAISKDSATVLVKGRPRASFRGFLRGRSLVPAMEKPMEIVEPILMPELLLPLRPPSRVVVKPKPPIPTSAEPAKATLPAWREPSLKRLRSSIPADARPIALHA